MAGTSRVAQTTNGCFGLARTDLDEIVARARADLESLRGARLFVTGGTGFFGKWLLAALARAETELALGARLTILSRAPEKFLRQWPEAAAQPGWTFFAGEVGEVPLLLHRFDFLIHAATDTLGIATPAEEQARAHAVVAGMARMLELAERSGVRRLLHISSGAVYGARAAQPHGAREEDFAGAVPLTPYAIAKRQAEELCVGSKIEVATARAFAFLGPHLALDAHYAAGNFLRDARRGGPIEVRGDGTAVRSYLHPVDLVVWLLALLARGGRGRAYNVGSDEAVTTAELARAIAAEINPEPEVVIRAPPSAGPPHLYLPNVARARSELGLEIRVPLRDSIRRTLAFLRSLPPA